MKKMSEYYTQYRAEIEPLLTRVFRTVDKIKRDVLFLEKQQRLADAENLAILSERLVDAAYDLEIALDLAKKR